MHSIHSVLHLFILLTYTQQMTPKFHPFLKNTPIYILMEYRIQCMNIIKYSRKIITYEYSQYTLYIQQFEPSTSPVQNNGTAVKRQIICFLTAITVLIAVLLYNIYLYSSIYSKHTFYIRSIPDKPQVLCAVSTQHRCKNSIFE